MKDFSLKITVRSERIIRAIEDRFGTQTEMSRKSGMSPGLINQYVCMKAKPYGVGGWKESAENFAGALGVNPSDLWPEHLREVILRRSTAELSLDADQVMALTSDDSNVGEQRQLLAASSSGLRDRHKLAVSMSASGSTFAEIGEELGVTLERARQIVVMSHRKMRSRLIAMGYRDMNSVQ